MFETAFSDQFLTSGDMTIKMSSGNYHFSTDTHFSFNTKSKPPGYVDIYFKEKYVNYISLKLNTTPNQTWVTWGINVDDVQFKSENQYLTHGCDLSRKINRKCKKITVWMNSSQSWMAMQNVGVSVKIYEGLEINSS